MKPGRRNSDDAVLKRRTVVSELYLAGRTQYQISLVVNVMPQQVSHDLKRIREQWRTTTLQNYDQKIDLELAKADEVEHEAWEAWDSSIGKHTAVMEKEGQGGPGIITRTELSPGDPRFPHPAPLGGSSAFIANTGRVTYRAESLLFSLSLSRGRRQPSIASLDM